MIVTTTNMLFPKVSKITGHISTV